PRRNCPDAHARHPYRGSHFVALDLAPGGRLAEDRAQLLRYLALLREPAQFFLVEDDLVIELHQKNAVCSCSQLDAFEERSPKAEHLLRQAHGLVEVISR